MADRGWLPDAWRGLRGDDDHPFGALRRQIDSLLEDFDRAGPALAGAFDVRTNVSETDGEVRITAELPGISLDDVEVSVTGRRIAVSGQKTSEEEQAPEEGRQFHRVERRSGSFRREMTLPFEIDPEKVSAEAKDGVLTVRVPKPPEEVAKARKIEVKPAG